jgi:hypothetical protein
LQSIVEFSQWEIPIPTYRARTSDRLWSTMQVPKRRVATRTLAV